MVRALQVAVALLVLVGCGGDAEPAERRSDPVRLSATATRSSLFDSQRTLRLELANTGGEPVVVETVQLDSGRFAPEDPSPRDTELAPVRRLLLPLPYGEAVCPGSEEPPLLRAEVGGELIEVPLDERPDGLLAALQAGECDEATVRQAAEVSFGEDWTPTGPRSALGRVRIEPRSTEPAVRTSVQSISGNIVFGVRLRDGILPATTTFPVELVVDRCDTHALIESKRTFRFPLDISLDGGPAIVYALEAEPGSTARAVLGRLIQGCIGEE